MSATCTNGYIRRVIGVTRNFAWTILTDGEAVSLEGRDLTLVLIHPRGNKEEMEFAAVNNVVTFSWQGKDQKELGRYGIILYENYGKPNQLRVDIHKFLELIPWSDREAGSYADLTETHTDLGTNEISGEIIVVDNLTSTSTSSALSANMGRVLKEDIDALAQQMGGVTVLSTLQAVDAAAVYADIHAGKQIVLDYEGSYVLLSSYTTGQRNGTPIVDMLEFADEYFDPTDGVETVTYFVWRYSDGWEGGETALATTDQVRAKQDVIEDLSTIRSGAAAGATAYQKPSTGIPKTDLASAVQTSLGKADTSVQNKGSESNIVVGVGNSSNIGITSSSIGMETGNSAILIGNDITLDTSGAVKYNGSRVATATDLQGKQDVIRDLQTIRDGAAAGATAVQPAALQEGLAGKQDTISDLSTIRSGASAGATAYQKPQAGIPKTDLASAVQTSLDKADTAVQPAAMNTALASKQDTLTFDNAPTANSNNPVKSGGVKTAIDAKQDTISTVNVTVDNNTGTPSGSASVSGSTMSLSFQNLKGATGATGPQGIQGVQGIQGPKGDTGVTGDASSLAIIHGIDKTTTYQVTDVCGADAAQTLLNLIEGGFYY